jgi:hypothetical protein
LATKKSAKTKAAESSVAPVAPVIVSYKGFDANMQCHGGGSPFAYEVGKAYGHAGEVLACNGGFHACEYPLDVLAYYPAAGSRFAQVEQSGTISKHADDSKVASSSISIKAEISLPGLISAAIEYTMSRVNPALSDANKETRGSASNSGDRGAASNSGYSGAASNSGDRGAASNSGDSGAASNSGYSGAASNSGYSGAASNSGDRGAASNSGYRGAASNSGDSGAASNSGYRGAASNSGDSGAASNSGDSGAASNSGYSGAASNSGDSGAASNSGDRGAASNSGKAGIAADFNGWGRAKSCETGAIVCVNRDDAGNIRHIRASKVGENGIKADVWYSLDAAGEFVAEAA